jgi:hypothetical protein
MMVMTFRTDGNHRYSWTRDKRSPFVRWTRPRLFRCNTTSWCRSAAFWLMHGVRAAIPQASPLAKCEFATLRERLIKIGARVIEHVARIRVQLPTSCPHAALFRCVALGLMPSGP